MTEYLEPEGLTDRRAAYVKWLIFGVLLPLLPFAARALAGWLDNSSSSLSFTALFSDGELLVVATVISAAVIGDLLFDFSGRGAERERTTIALLCAFSLLVVVVSVLMFGLVTLDNQNRSDAVQQAQSTEAMRADQASQLLAEALQQERQASSLSAQAKHLNNELRAALQRLNKTIFGTGGSPAGFGPVAASIHHQVSSLEAQAQETMANATELTTRATAERQHASQILVKSIENLSIGRRQAAIMSVAMFVISWITGGVALFFSTTRPPKKVESTRSNGVPLSGLTTAEAFQQQSAPDAQAPIAATDTTTEP